MPIDSSVIAASAALVGSVVGALASVGTTFIGQRHQAKRQRLAAELTVREELYTNLIEEAMPLFVDSIEQTSFDPGKLLRLYSVVARIRLVANDDVLRGAEKVVADLLESYKRPVTDVKLVIQQVGHDAVDPMRDFTEACRRERSDILRQL